MTLMQKRSQSGSRGVPPASRRQLSLLDLMTKSWKMINADLSVQGSGQNL